jgi:hypothetical protein
MIMYTGIYEFISRKNWHMMAWAGYFGYCILYRTKITAELRPKNKVSVMGALSFELK